MIIPLWGLFLPRGMNGHSHFSRNGYQMVLLILFQRYLIILPLFSHSNFRKHFNKVTYFEKWYLNEIDFVIKKSWILIIEPNTWEIWGHTFRMIGLLDCNQSCPIISGANCTFIMGKISFSYELVGVGPIWLIHITSHHLALGMGNTHQAQSTNTYIWSQGLLIVEAAPSF